MMENGTGFGSDLKGWDIWPDGKPNELNSRIPLPQSKAVQMHYIFDTGLDDDFYAVHWIQNISFR